ncbi:putative RNA-directed DNA polymerase [Tanacetum coccineum]
MRIRYGKVCKMTKERILKDHWKERFGGEEDDLEKYLEGLEECGEDKANIMLRVIPEKLNNDWFNNTSKDKDDLEGILDYLKPRSYDGFINLDDEAYNKRRCRLFGMTYGEPTPILIEKAKVTRYTVYPGETYTKVKVLGVEKIPRTRDNVAAMRARLMKKIAQEGNNQAKTDQVSILAKDKGFGQEMHQSEEPKGECGLTEKLIITLEMKKDRFILRYENKDYVLDKQISTIDDDSTQEEIEAHQKHYDDANKVSCIMASSMIPELQKTFENTWAYEMNQQLKEMFKVKASKEHLDVVKSLVACKPKLRASICSFVLEMKGYFDKLESLNMVFDVEHSINIILSRIKKIDVPSTSAAPVLTVGHNAKKIKTSNSNWKGKAEKEKSDRGSKRKAESNIAPISDPKEAVCFYCNTKGHWKRSCLKYLKDLKDEKVKKRSYSGMFMIELYNTTTSDLWVLDTWCGTHICTILEGLKESRRLKHGELNLVMGNRKITPVTRIGKYELMLKSGVRIDLNNCCYSHNGNVILNVGSSNELDKSKLWHSHLGHVNKKRIAQLQKDGVLESFDFKSDDMCVDHSDLPQKMENATTYQNEVENQLGRKIKVLRSDRGGEYLSIEFFDHLKNYGIVSQLTPPRTPQLNRVAERRNRTLLDMVRSMMSRATLPISFWGYALETAAHILNLVPTKKVLKTPFEMWKRKRPSLRHIKIWGCEVYDRRESQEKLEARSEKCLFVSYPEESFGYLFYKPKDNVSTDEELIVNTDTQPEVVTPVKPDDISLPIRRTSGRVSKPPQFYYGFHIEEDKISDSTLSELDEPANYKEAMAILEATNWKEAMKMGCKWIFKKKTVMNGKVHTYKARLVSKGYTQTHGIDYEETFSPVAKIKSIRIMLAIAAFHDYEIWQMSRPLSLTENRQRI